MYLLNFGLVVPYAIKDFAKICSGNGLWPVRHQAINWTSVALMPIGHIGTNFVQIRANIRKLPLNKTRTEYVVCKISAVMG